MLLPAQHFSWCTLRGLSGLQNRTLNKCNHWFKGINPKGFGRYHFPKLWVLKLKLFLHNNFCLSSPSVSWMLSIIIFIFPSSTPWGTASYFHSSQNISCYFCFIFEILLTQINYIYKYSFLYLYKIRVTSFQVYLFGIGRYKFIVDFYFYFIWLVTCLKSWQK